MLDLGPAWPRLRFILGLIWNLLGALGRLGASLGPSWAALGHSWLRLGVLLELFWSLLGILRTILCSIDNFSPKSFVRPKVWGRCSGPKELENRAPVEARARFSCFCFFSKNELKQKAGAVGFGVAWGNFGAKDGPDMAYEEPT